MRPQGNSRAAVDQKLVVAVSAANKKQLLAKALESHMVVGVAAAGVAMAGPYLPTKMLVVVAQVLQAEVGHVSGWGRFGLTLLHEINSGLAGFPLLFLAGIIHEGDLGP